MEIQKEEKEIRKCFEQMHQWHERAQRGERNIGDNLDVTTVHDRVEKYQESIGANQLSVEFETFFQQYQEVRSCIQRSLFVSSVCSVDETNQEDTIEEEELNMETHMLSTSETSVESDFEVLKLDQLPVENHSEQLTSEIESPTTIIPQSDISNVKCTENDLTSNLLHFSGYSCDWYIFEKLITKQVLESNQDLWKKFYFLYQSLGTVPRQLICHIDPYDPECIKKAMSRLRRCYNVGYAPVDELIRSMITVKTGSLAIWQRLLHMAVIIESRLEVDSYNTGKVVQELLRCMPEWCANELNDKNASLDAIIQLLRRQVRLFQLNDDHGYHETSTSIKSLSAKINNKSLLKLCPICKLLSVEAIHQRNICSNVDKAIQYLQSLKEPRVKKHTNNKVLQPNVLKSPNNNEPHPKNNNNNRARNPTQSFFNVNHKKLHYKIRLAILANRDTPFYYNAKLDVNVQDSWISTDECTKIGIDATSGAPIKLTSAVGWTMMPISFLVKNPEQTGGYPVLLGRNAAFLLRIWAKPEVSELQQRLKISESEEMPSKAPMQAVQVGEIKLAVRPFHSVDMKTTMVDWLIENQIVSRKNSLPPENLSPFMFDFGEDNHVWLCEPLPGYTMHELKAQMQSTPCKLTVFVLQTTTMVSMLLVKAENSKKYTILSLPHDTQERRQLYEQIALLQKPLSKRYQ